MNSLLVGNAETEACTVSVHFKKCSNLVTSALSCHLLLVAFSMRKARKNFGFGQLIFKNWSGGTVEPQLLPG